MAGMRVAVLGGGPTGCAAALHLAESGCDVVLVDRDDISDSDGAGGSSGSNGSNGSNGSSGSSGSADDIFASADRPAVGQFRQPHNFLGLGRRILLADFPDVYYALLRAGAGEIHQNDFLGTAPREPGDSDLATITCRRPVIDAVWRTAMGRHPSVTFRPGVVGGLSIRGGSPPHVTGVELTTGETIAADLVVDASGRNSECNKWLRERAATGWDERTSDCRLLYYSRHYRFTDGPLPHVSLLGGPRGDTGYLAFAVFLGDNETFCLCIMTPVWQPEWRALRDPEAFERVARSLPGVGAWLDAATPITQVLPMGQLRNVVRRTVDGDGRPTITGLLPIGDTRCHTNPTFAFGLSLGLAHAVALGDVIAGAADDASLVTTFEEQFGADAAARFDAVSAEDRDRIRMWSGEPIDPTDRADTMPLFLRTVVFRAAMQDPALLRAVCRRMNGLDPVDALSSDADLLDHAERLARELPPPPPPPHRDAVLAALTGG